MRAVSCACTRARGSSHLLYAQFPKVKCNYKMLFMEDIKVSFNFYLFRFDLNIAQPKLLNSTDGSLTHAPSEGGDNVYVGDAGNMERGGSVGDREEAGGDGARVDSEAERAVGRGHAAADRKSTRLNSSHRSLSRMPSSA